jgi:hypothetical protein
MLSFWAPVINDVVLKIKVPRQSGMQFHVEWNEHESWYEAILSVNQW